MIRYLVIYYRYYSDDPVISIFNRADDAKNFYNSLREEQAHGASIWMSMNGNDD